MRGRGGLRNVEGADKGKDDKEEDKKYSLSYLC